VHAITAGQLPFQAASCRLDAGPQGRDAAPLAEWTELENGCICCSAKNDMVKALEALMQQRERFDYVLIETTGLANPGPVAAALWTDEQLESRWGEGTSLGWLGLRLQLKLQVGLRTVARLCVSQVWW
jgi:hypothetical protein